MRDIDKRKRTEKELKKSEELYRTLIKTSPDPVVITDLLGNIKEVFVELTEKGGAYFLDSY